MKRRHFIQTSILATAAPLLTPKEGFAQRLSQLDELEDEIAPPSPEVLVLNKIAYGPSKKDLAYIRKIGVKAYIKEQLSPEDNKDREVKKRLAKAKFPIKYEGTPADPSVRVDELRPLTSLDKSLQELWKDKADMKTYNFKEWIRPAMETFSANAIKAVYSKWQLREMMVDFWYNHFNITINGNVAVGSTVPSYDRDVIRKHCFGNFREFIEAVGKSTCMMFYLNNQSSKASPANENYARELFELHTLGEENYLNELFNEWREVPGALDGMAEGYIDEDVYEAARAFTGWTIGTGKRTWRGEERLPDSGEFYYYDNWHDNYQKRILGVEFPSNQPPMADGEKVYDILAAHPGTARHLSRKLCIRFVSDQPSEELIARVAKKWIDTVKAPDQIKQVLTVILESDEFMNSYGKKVKRPFELASSFIRATGSDFSPNQVYFWNLAGMGQRMLMWPSPNGHPDDSSFWVSTGMMINRWKFIRSAIHWKANSAVTHRFEKDFPSNKTYEEVYSYYEQKIIGYSLPKQKREKAIAVFCKGNSPTNKMEGAYAKHKHKVLELITLLGSTPEFNLR